MAVTSPTDFPGTLPDLRTIDNLLRCSICFDYLNIAMMIPSCSHNYCSLCIRRYLKYKRQCPTCNMEVCPSTICNNRTLDNIVKHFVTVRPFILKKFALSDITSDEGGQTPTRKHFSTKTKIPAKTSPSSDASTLILHFGTPRSSPTSAQSELSSASDDVPSQDDHLNTPTALAGETDSEVTLRTDGKTNVSGSESQLDKSFPSTSSGLVLGQSSPGSSKNKVDCPVCGVSISNKYINAHLDSCLRRMNAPETTQRSLKRKRIPMMVWKLLSDKEIRSRVSEYKLSTKGKRYELIKRLEEYILLYNAQCDAEKPKSADEIARVVEMAENVKSQPLNLRESKVHKLKIEEGMSEEQMQASRSKYMVAHKHQFSQLIAEARARMRTDTSKEPANERNSHERSPEFTDLESMDLSNDSSDHVAVCKSSLGSPPLTSSSQGDSTNLISPSQPNVQSRLLPVKATNESQTTEQNTAASTTQTQRCEASGGISPGLEQEMPTNHKEPVAGLLDSHCEPDDPVSKVTVLAPSSPSLSSKDNTQQHRPSVEARDEGLTNPGNDAHEPTFIPESPLSGMAFKRSRKRKKHECPSTTSESGSSLGEEGQLRRSKRERKAVKKFSNKSL